MFLMHKACGSVEVGHDARGAAIYSRQHTLEKAGWSPGCGLGM